MLSLLRFDECSRINLVDDTRFQDSAGFGRVIFDEDSKSEQELFYVERVDRNLSIDTIVAGSLTLGGSSLEISAINSVYSGNNRLGADDIIPYLVLDSLNARPYSMQVSVQGSRIVVYTNDSVVSGSDDISSSFFVHYSNNDKYVIIDDSVSFVYDNSSLTYFQPQLLLTDHLFYNSDTIDYSDISTKDDYRVYDHLETFSRSLVNFEVNDFSFDYQQPLFVLQLKQEVIPLERPKADYLVIDSINVVPRVETSNEAEVSFFEYSRPIERDLQIAKQEIDIRHEFIPVVRELSEPLAFEQQYDVYRVDEKQLVLEDKVDNHVSRDYVLPSLEPISLDNIFLETVNFNFYDSIVQFNTYNNVPIKDEARNEFLVYQSNDEFISLIRSDDVVSFSYERVPARERYVAFEVVDNSSLIQLPFDQFVYNNVANVSVEDSKQDLSINFAEDSHLFIPEISSPSVTYTRPDVQDSFVPNIELEERHMLQEEKGLTKYQSFAQVDDLQPMLYFSLDSSRQEYSVLDYSKVKDDFDVAFDPYIASSPLVRLDTMRSPSIIDAVRNRSIDMIVDNVEDRELDIVMPEYEAQSLAHAVAKPYDESDNADLDLNYSLNEPQLITMTRPFEGSKGKNEDEDIDYKKIVPIRSNTDPEPPLLDKEKPKKKDQCEDSSQCYSEVIKWLEGKLDDPTLTDEEYESISQCYAEDIKNIKKAREYIKKRKDGYVCSGSLRGKFHHNDPRFKLKDYVRNGKVQEGFKLAERLTVRFKENDMKEENIEAYNTKTSETVIYKQAGDTLFAYLNRHLSGTIVWKDFTFIDTETGDERSGVYWDQKYKEMKSCLYLQTIAEYHNEANESLGDKDEHGMKLNGIIILINGKESKSGTGTLWNYKLKQGDVIEIVYKNDAARYDSSEVISFPSVQDRFVNRKAA